MAQIEKVLRAVSTDVRESIIEEFFRADSIPTLLEDSYGNFVLQHAYDLASVSSQQVCLFEFFFSVL